MTRLRCASVPMTMAFLCPRVWAVADLPAYLEDALTPPAMARSQSPVRKAIHARWIAVSEDEHAHCLHRHLPKGKIAFENVRQGGELERLREQSERSREVEANVTKQADLIQQRLDTQIKGVENKMEAAISVSVKSAMISGAPGIARSGWKVM